ncbi:MAG TPA: Hsp20/alpha crystallin family protein [Acetobacteraceae bacterium]|nr:Hsp20/alpha crystallin family protein [Acetobacteraceae bacterium]
MALFPMTPFRAGSSAADPFLSLHREMNRLFDDVLRGSVPGGAHAGPQSALLVPSMDVHETEKELRLTAELPGVREQDIEVTLDDDVLTVRAEKRVERSEERQDTHFSERAYGTFQRALRLPYPVQADQIHAAFENGVLTVTVPKAATQQRSRRIQVQGGPGAPPQVEGGSTQSD